LGPLSQKFNKKPRYSITTNGSLLTEEMIRFFGRNEFSVELSFDGSAQNGQRRPGSAKKIIPLIKRLLEDTKIHLEINSVFTPKSVDFLADSLESVINLGVRNVRFSLSILEPWNGASLKQLKKELLKIERMMIDHYKSDQWIPVVNFREYERNSIAVCQAGRDRLAVDPRGGVWGCALFPDYFYRQKKTDDSRSFYFGNISRFVANHQRLDARIQANYAGLSVDNFHTSKMPCFLCPCLGSCRVCPLDAAFSGGPIGKIPLYACQIQKIKQAVLKKFKKEAET